MTRSLGFSGFGELRRLPSSLSLSPGGGHDREDRGERLQEEEADAGMKGVSGFRGGLVFEVHRLLYHSS